MRKTLTLVAMAALLPAAGCASRGKALDEFAVARNAPLVIPPDYSLTPPQAGTATLAPEAVQGQAIEALFGGPAPRSQSESSMLEKAGAERASLGVRSTVGDPATQIVDKGATTQTILAAAETNGQDASASVP
ncbi:DUF3035 domain-containing protein [Sphingomonas ginkgonis]|uniref:DUF3035 domain-containing protein n=1 Tax=Sphingomonas ginkgonis TaxID=2315330 RepID=A0A3R9WN37_9SPHN|nr:DUF3035 domain-containing protein [Sphingomonas ginkgonis]RST30306.1 DUF3035 domain-containing protein [Sphingomonas ginkgonis]